MKFIAATLASVASAVLEAYEPKVDYWAISQGDASRYNMFGTYGTNEIGYWGLYNFLYM